MRKKNKGRVAEATLSMNEPFQLRQAVNILPKVRSYHNAPLDVASCYSVTSGSDGLDVALRRLALAGLAVTDCRANIIASMTL